MIVVLLTKALLNYMFLSEVTLGWEISELRILRFHKSIWTTIWTRSGVEVHSASTEATKLTLLLLSHTDPKHLSWDSRILSADGMSLLLCGKQSLRCIWLLKLQFLPQQVPLFSREGQWDKWEQSLSWVCTEDTHD